MNTPLSRLVICGLAFGLTLISGVILSHLGKPYNTVTFTIHKLIAVGTAIAIAVSIYNLQKAADVHAFSVVTFVVTGLLFLALIVSGALLSLVAGTQLSLDEPVLQAILRIHQVVPLLALVASTVSLYLLVSRQA